ncbi:hypothetical protein [Streptomyces sp. NPDC039016]|uniref:hypothetical protein n=1 Tax=Streptomyces sp. NPDC039016 TaxID=3154330 RepID=UPI00340EE86A
MADLFIGGHWRSARHGRTREIRCPADGSPVAVVEAGAPLGVPGAATRPQCDGADAVSLCL